MPILQILRSMLLRYYWVSGISHEAALRYFLQMRAISVIKAKTSGEGLDRETATLIIYGPSEGRADGQQKSQSLRLRTLNLLSSPIFILREAILPWSKLLYVERFIVARTVQVLVGSDSSNIEIGGQIARPQTGERHHMLEAGRRCGS